MKSSFFSTVILTLCFISATFAQSCTQVSGKGPVVKSTREASGFTKVQSNISGNVYVKTGSGFSVEVEGNQNILDILETKVDGGVLKIQLKPNTSVYDYKTLNVYVTAPVYDGLVVNGSGNLIADGALSGNSIDLAVNGSGDLNVKTLNYHQLEAAVSGSGDIKVDGGSADEVSLSVVGSGDLNAAALQARESKAEVTGSGDITCQASGTLAAKIVGSGDIRYKGNPSVSSKVVGSGDVSKI